MNKKILYGIISVAALSMITGCGSKASDGANNVNTTEVINTQDSQDTNSESEDSYMDSRINRFWMNHQVLRCLQTI